MSFEKGVVSSGTTRNKMVFLSRRLFRTDYVSIDCSNNASMLFEITSVVIKNDRLQDANFIRYLRDDEFYDQYSICHYEAVPLAMVSHSNEVIYDRWYIALPGSRVNEASDNHIALVNGIEQGENKLKIGYLIKCETVSVNLDFMDMFKAHTAIVGITGCGKTYFTLNLLRNVNMRSIIFSPTDEYDGEFGGGRYLNADTIKLSFEIKRARKIFNLNDSEVGLLNDYVKNCGLKQVFTSTQFSTDIENYYLGLSYEAALTEREKKRSKQSNQMTMFQPDATQNDEQNEDVIERSSLKLPRFVDTLCDKIHQHNITFTTDCDITDNLGKHTVINVQECGKEEEEIIAYSLLSSLYNRRKKNFDSGQQVAPNERLLIVLEEAHNFAPSQESAICRGIISNIARAGRKMGLHLVVLSQRPRHIDQTLLSNCGNVFAFNLPNPDDIDYLMKESPFYNLALKSGIQNLSVGQCYIKNRMFNAPLMCKVDFS